MAGRQIYILTDFGEGPYTGTMKAVVKSINSDLEVIDLDNSLPSFKVIAGAYVLAGTYYWTPRGSILITIVDPGVGTLRDAVLVEAGNYVFVGPNNGVLYPAVAREGYIRGYKLDPERVMGEASTVFKGKLPGGKWPLSHTFHGRDIFAPAAALYASGVDPERLGDPLDPSRLKRVVLEDVEEVGLGYRLKVIYVDKYGDVALSARPGMLPFSSWSRVLITAEAATETATVGEKFMDVPGGDLVLYVNSFGFIEVAVNQGNAAKKLGVDVGDTIVVTPIA